MAIVAKRFHLSEPQPRTLQIWTGDRGLTVFFSGFFSPQRCFCRIIRWLLIWNIPQIILVVWCNIKRCFLLCPWANHWTIPLPPISSLKYINNRCKFKMGAEINTSPLKTPAPGWNHSFAPVWRIKHPSIKHSALRTNAVCGQTIILCLPQP